MTKRECEIDAPEQMIASREGVERPTARGRRSHAPRVYAALLMSITALVAVNPRPARADSYSVATETDLRNAITAANGNTDPSATITLTGNITMSDPAAFAAATKPITIHTGSFTLSGADVASGNGIGPSFQGVSLVVNGTLQGGDTGTTTFPIRGGPGLTLTDGSIVNNGTIAGGDGGGASAEGVGLTNATLENNGTIRSGIDAGGRTGSAIFATDSIIINNGTLDGVISAPGNTTVISNGSIRAIALSGNNNVLELRAGHVNTDPTPNRSFISLLGSNDTLVLGGSEDGSFDVSNISGSFPFPSRDYDGFDNYKKTGTSTWTLTGTAVANAVISWQLLEGTLSVSSDTNLSGAAGTLTFNGGTLRVTGTSFTSTPRTITWGANGGGLDIADAANTFTLGQSLTGGGPLTKLGAGTLVLTGTNTYTGGTTINGGTLQLGNGGTTGTLAGDVANNAALVFNRSNTLSIDGAISGSGVVNQLGAGTTILTGTNTYTGGTTITAGTLQLGNGGASGSLVGDVINDATLIANRSGELVLSGVIAGSGVFEQSGAGTTILTGDNTYTGGTTITAGTLQLGDSGASGAIAGDVVNDGTLAFNRSNTLAFSGVISGAGTVRQIGSGLTNLTADSSGFTGTTSIEAGTLSVNGSLCGDMNVRSGGRLQGTGTVCATTNFSGGTIAPGNSIGTLLVSGDYTGNGGVLEMEAVLAGTGSPADRLVITGNATGTTPVRVINVGGAGALTGTTSTNGISIVQVGGTSTASAFTLQGGYVAGGPYQYRLNAFEPGASAAGEADPLLGTTSFWDYRLQSDGSLVPQVPAYQALPSGALGYGSSLLNSLHKRLGEIRHVALVESKDGNKEQNAETFLRSQGFHSDFSGDRGPDYQQNIGFIQGGANYVGRNVGAPGATLRLGGALSYGGSSLAVKGTSAKVELNGPSLALTSTYQAARGWYVDGVVQGTRYFAKVRTSERGQTGDPKGWGGAVSVEGGYPLEVREKLIVEPQAQLSYQRVAFDKFTDVDRIKVDLESGDSLRGRLGLRTQKTIEIEEQKWSPFLELNVVHEFLREGEIKASGVTFGSDTGGTSLQFGGGLNAQLGPNAAVFLGVTYEKGVTKRTADSGGGTLGLRVNW